MQRGFWLADPNLPDDRHQREDIAGGGGKSEPIRRSRQHAGRRKRLACERQVSRQDHLAEQLLAAAFRKTILPSIDDCVLYFKPSHQEVFRYPKSGKSKSDDPSLDEIGWLGILAASGGMGDAEVAALKAELAKEY